MRVVLRQAETGLYCQGPRKWGKDSGKARSFHGGIDALLFASENRLRGTEVVFEFENARYNFSVKWDGREEKVLGLPGNLKVSDRNTLPARPKPMVRARGSGRDRKMKVGNF
jgi:hypothetical protein